MLPRSLSSNLSRSLIRRSITTSPHLITPITTNPPSTTTTPSNPIITESHSIPTPNPTPIETHFGFKNVPEDQKEDMGTFG